MPYASKRRMPPGLPFAIQRLGVTLCPAAAVFLAARILVNPRCVTTYAGVSHTQLALDLFGPPDREEEREVGRADVRRRSRWACRPRRASF